MYTRFNWFPTVHQCVLLQTWLSYNSSMDKSSHALTHMLCISNPLLENKSNDGNSDNYHSVAEPTAAPAQPRAFLGKARIQCPRKNFGMDTNRPRTTPLPSQCVLRDLLQTANYILRDCSQLMPQEIWQGSQKKKGRCHEATKLTPSQERLIIES